MKKQTASSLPFDSGIDEATDLRTGEVAGRTMTRCHDAHGLPDRERYGERRSAGMICCDVEVWVVA